MPSATAPNTSAKRVLTETTNARNNVAPLSPANKKRKIDSATKLKPAQVIADGAPRSSQPSRFESEVLQNLSQGINNLKDNNAEKDQQWKRPSLATFNEKTDTLCFQQIEAEEGTINGDKATVKLFGVSEVQLPWRLLNIALANIVCTGRSFSSPTRYRLRSLSIHCCSRQLSAIRLQWLPSLS